MESKTLMDGFKIIWPYYENPGQLKKQIEILNQYSKDARQKIEVIIVDDGSQKNPALETILDNPCRVLIKLLRIKQNIPWNQHGARNLGAKFAGSESWLFMTDIDHLLMPDQADKLLSKTLHPKLYYIFNRVSAPEMEVYKIHYNSFIVLRSVYWRAGGYDEDYCGSYGGDGIFLSHLNNISARTFLKDVTIVRVPRDVQPDASTTEWDRDGYYKTLYRARVQEKRNKGNIFPKDPLRFDWERQL